MPHSAPHVRSRRHWLPYCFAMRLSRSVSGGGCRSSTALEALALGTIGAVMGAGAAASPSSSAASPGPAAMRAVAVVLGGALSRGQPAPNSSARRDSDQSAPLMSPPLARVLVRMPVLAPVRVRVLVPAPRVLPPHPVRPFRPVLALPDRDARLDPVDQEPAGSERLPAVRRARCAHDGGVPDVERPHAMHHREP